MTTQNLLPLSQALQLALRSFQESDLQQTERICRQILQAVPEQPDALHLLGVVAYHTQHYQSAIQLIEQAIKINPELLDAYYNLASIHQALQQFDLAVAWYEKGFSGTFSQKINLEAVLEMICSQPIASWQNIRKHFIQYCGCLHRLNLLQHVKSNFSALVDKLDFQHLPEDQAIFIIFTLLDVLQFNKATERAWNEYIFATVTLPLMKKALESDYYELGLNLEGYIYNHYVKQKETEENFRTCFEGWIKEMCAAGQRAGKSLPVLDRTVLHDKVPTIGFFVHNASLLAHIEVLLNMLEGMSKLEKKPFKPIIYVFGGYHEGMSDRCQQINVPLVLFSQLCDDKGCYRRLLFLRERVLQDKVAALVWVSLATLMSFAFSMRIAPVQIWWAMKFHSLEFADIDGYVTGSSGGEFKKIGDRVWRTAGLGRNDWYAPELEAEAQNIRTQYYERFDVILGTMGREEKLDNPEFIETVAKVLQKYPKAAFLWTGRNHLPSIQSIFDKYNVAEQCFFIGWVNTKLYAQVFDIFLDSFPFPCGFTAFEALAAMKPIVLYSSDESYGTGLHGCIFPILEKKVGINSEQKTMYNIFHENGKKLYFCADTADEYFDYACRLIDDKVLRQQTGIAYSQFLKYFFTSTEKMASGYAQHFLSLINKGV